MSGRDKQAKAIANAKKAAEAKPRGSTDLRSYEQKIANIWRLLKNATPEEQVEITSKLSEDDLNALRMAGNPYKKPIYLGGNEKILAFSVTNLEEKYAQRFAMTSLIGFTNRMVDEYEAPGRDKFMSESDPAFADKFNAKVKTAKFDKPMALLKEAVDVAETPELAAAAEYQLVVFECSAAVKQRDALKDKTDKLDLDITKMNDTIRRINNELVSDREKLAALIKHENERAAARNNTPTPAPILQSAGPRATVAMYTTIVENKETLKTQMTEKIAALEPDLNNAAIELKRLELQIAAWNDRKKELVKKAGDVTDPEPYQMTEDEYDEIAEEVKTELGITKTAEEYDIEVRNHVEQFLNSYFLYNPDLHVRAAHKPNYAYMAEAAKKLSEDTPQTKGPAIDLRALVPPNDTFFRWNRYIENNYEELRQATDDIYSERSDLDFAIIPLATMNSMKEYDEFKRKYADEFDMEVYAANFGAWSFLAPWEPNREVRDFYTENTEIIKQIIDRSRDDQRYGAKLMKDRAQKKKNENIRKEGPHAGSFNDYKHAMNPTGELEKHGARHIDNLPENAGSALTHDRLPRDLAESKQDEVEVGVHVIKPIASRRRIRGEVDQWKINVPAERLDKGEAKVVTAKDLVNKKN